MRDRKKMLERLLAVKTELHRLEEARLAQIETQRLKALDEKQAMFRFLEFAEHKDPLLLRLACSRVVAAERGASALDARADRQRQILTGRAEQKKRVEKLLKDAAEALDRENEKRALLDLAERLAEGARTSLP
jgi:hypothetical protein